MTVTDPAGPPAPTQRRRRIGLIVTIVVIVAMLGMWAWVFAYHLGGSWRDTQPGKLDDPTFAVAAEPVCAAAMAELAVLTPAWATDTPAERADVLDQSVTILSSMVADLAGLPAGTETTQVNEWISDWGMYVEDRADYATRLRDDPEARFYVTQSDRDRRQITLAIDRFAKTNAMLSCVTPADLS